LILTDINSNDVVLSRVASDLILTVKSTGEYIDFTNFYPTNTGDWEVTARNKLNRGAAVLAACEGLRILFGSDVRRGKNPMQTN
jgi:hypothetical protein